ncbi:hypothetical protein Taro_015632 [Colocasia esculenta]|uniref:Uncharacterized protein n=1 Tax=Colocasia esculenta TaxID=4460 RepID=A0A843UMS8_COLES|nr:hypothetical protein [Colocasia esculenta]
MRGPRAMRAEWPTITVRGRTRLWRNGRPARLSI